jgi:hypothetical protein
MRMWRLLSLVAIAGAIVGGCGRSNPVDAPFVSAGSAASAAIAAYDKNGDGELSAEELDKSPGIKKAIEKADANQDGMLSHGELKDRVAKFVGDQVGLMSLHVKVLMAGQPLPDATVKLIPDPCLGNTFKPAQGTTGADGQAGLRMADNFPGVQCGWFRVEVSKMDAGGQNSIPAKYNTETTLGAEIALDRPEIERGLTLELKSGP